MAQFIDIHPQNPQVKHLNTVVECLRDGGVIIYPTDTVYGIGCDINKARAVERVCKIKGIKPEKSNFSLICYDLSQLSVYSKNVSTPIYKVMRKSLPGPFTYILEANSHVPKLFKHKKNTVGIRIPDNNIIREIVRMLENPVLSSSVKDDDEIIEYTTDPELIYEKFKDKVDIVINGGYGNNEASTVVDCSGGDFVIVRQGLGNLDEYI
ncbi:MAG: threonylcarbamoyl-AMP synthase [Bacteroidia bacterium]|nr:threonylcarbamoyl-AMP synthase [Bacteroidia bacterium]MCZ2247958.1 threonylcarbamoyl-AMP synthase [Bacteroidia bacterium]